MAQFKELGFWTLREKSMPLVIIDDVLYTLDGWDGKSHIFSQKVLDRENQILSRELYVVTQHYTDEEAENLLDYSVKPY